MGKPFWNLLILSHLHVDWNTAIFIDKFPNLRKLCLEFSDHTMVRTSANLRRFSTTPSLENGKYGDANMENGDRPMGIFSFIRNNKPRGAYNRENLMWVSYAQFRRNIKLSREEEAVNHVTSFFMNE
ncbi:hypothetical protein FEM48_Zijuj07G0138900 [Ziziphus jujuba var. spinosa]|uniref:Uncharacterized protein n=1 Tax=Ziziphus jujuba var. spinosa TaxID=714518 RepID=A0A978V510_ZIZJJ|nr:hypothetical protein FEM48_Zijuj07G0138900 [Ziziphus jujuba var. spinosa]